MGCNPVLPLSVLVFVALCFFPSLVILTFFFSCILRGSSTKRTYYRSAFVIAFSGLAIVAAIALAAPLLLPESPRSFGERTRFVPVMDVGIVFAVIAWVLLLRHYCGTSWLESLPAAITAAVVYVVLTAVASGFTLILVQP